MLEFSQVHIEALAVHRVGCSLRDGELRLARELAQIDDQEATALLAAYWLSPFKRPLFYSLARPEGEAGGPVWQAASAIFEDPGQLLSQSATIAQHLYQRSQHPAIREGELYVALLSGCVVEGEEVNALGVFKSESKETFLRVYPKGDAFGVQAQEGISVGKLDKGCLIFNTEKELGYKAVALDRTNGPEGAQYWMDRFLGLAPRANDFYQTSGYLSLCKDFVKDVVAPQGALSRAEQAVMLNDARDFFGQNDLFKQDVFEQQVLREPKLIEAFREHKEAFQAEKGCDLRDSFTISVDAAREARKAFKSVIKLDKHFHLYIHGGHDRVSRGFDRERGLSYYTLYFDTEW